MSIRIRESGGLTIALCAVEADALPGDIYLDDAQHYALAAKFANDWQGQIVNWQYPEEWAEMTKHKLRDAEEELNEWLALEAAARTPEGIETDASGEAMICTGCGTTRTLAAVKASHGPQTLSCCPERKMIPARRLWEAQAAARTPEDVTEAMTEAGRRAAWEMGVVTADVELESIYRAMRDAALLDLLPAQSGGAS